MKTKHGNVKLIHSGNISGKIRNFLIWLKQEGMRRSIPDYTDENVSDKLVKIMQSYTGVVDKMGW